ncbi:MAG TPA: hypothetical protein VEU77_06425, partial [Candidatus Acidoferrales bacterium]|nr:hypothetical protein [Candidatus Acidoferrales bacterium]
PFGLRSQYLAGGVDAGWTTWAPDGRFVSDYATESFAQNITPVFDYYMLLHSSPIAAGDEGDRDYATLNDTAIMARYFADLRTFFQRAAAAGPRTVVLHFEPDLWGFIQRRALFSDPALVPVKVGSTAFDGLDGLPDSAVGLARAIVSLRDRYGPNVLLAYHLSSWGTGQDILYLKPPLDTVELLAHGASAFYASLDASFDLVFAESSDRDAGFKVAEYGDRAAWWGEDDYARNVRFLATFARDTGKRIVLWQMPIGNTKMRAVNNTWGHYQDNHVEWLLDDPSRAHLRAYADAGVVGAIFGPGGSGATCACDALHDGVTDPSPINGNVARSFNADDDGGFFRARAAAYYAAGALELPHTPNAPAEVRAEPCLMPFDGMPRLCEGRRQRRR